MQLQTIQKIKLFKNSKFVASNYDVSVKWSEVRSASGVYGEFG